MTADSPADTLRQITLAHYVSASLHRVADLGIADRLGDSPQTAADLAVSVGANEDAVLRMVRLLSAYGVFKVDGGLVSHTEASRLLRSDHPRSQRAITRLEGNALTWPMLAELEYTLRTGRPAMEKLLPDPWAYMGEHPEFAQLVSDGMTSKAKCDIPSLLEVYDFSRFAVIGDIGGGQGHLINAILDAQPGVTGVLFDLPAVTARVDLRRDGRLTVQGGDFFRDALPECDAYLLMDVIHDWSDEKAIPILQCIRRSAPSHAKLLLIEALIVDTPGPSYAKLMDVHMLVAVGGRQRTQREFAALCHAAQFRLIRTVATHATFGLTILEAECR